MERMKSLEELASQYVRLATSEYDAPKERRERIDRAFVKTVRAMRRSLGISFRQHIPCNSPKYVHKIPVRSYVQLMRI